MGTQRKRGGPRPGSGRKPLTGTATYSAKIYPRQAALLRQWGNGNMSAGLRWLIDAAEPFVNKGKL